MLCLLNFSRSFSQPLYKANVSRFVLPNTVGKANCNNTSAQNDKESSGSRIDLLSTRRPDRFDNEISKEPFDEVVTTKKDQNENDKVIGLVEGVTAQELSNDRKKPGRDRFCAIPAERARKIKKTKHD